MVSELKMRLLKIPVLDNLIRLVDKIKIPGLEGLSLYDVVEMYVLGIIKGALSSRASAISFSFFMAIFPFLLFILNLIPFVPIQDFQADVFAFIDGILPPQTSDFFNGIIIDIMNNRRGGLLSVVFILSLFLTTNGVQAVFAGFENSYHVEVNRSFFKQYLVSFGVAIILATLLLTTVIGIVFFEFFINILFENRVIEDALFWVRIGKNAFYFIILILNVGTLYYFGCTGNLKPKFFSVGLFLTTILLVGTTYLFGIYVEDFSRYNELYGSIGALLILMVYIWLNANILLLGFELNATLRALKSRNINNSIASS
ncbi:MAG: ribonuclease BN [Bacteroidetes bacterium HGW-Bacteroidetes-13]|nr:MAG: ribonuclease BN [Bacteroidetes bacterium HGW-Bacteroidetes-13]